MEAIRRARGRFVWLRALLAALSLVTGLVLLAAAPAVAAPPVNASRAAAVDIPAFPSTVPGSIVEGTVERLDPRVSKCGPIEGTVWYRISPAPDGTLTTSVQSEGLTPVIRIYSMAKAGSTERSCGAAGAGKAASASFVARRGDRRFRDRRHRVRPRGRRVRLARARSAHGDP